jgi:glutamate decarboxylase
MGVPEISLPVRNGQKPLNRADEVDDVRIIHHSIPVTFQSLASHCTARFGYITDIFQLLNAVQKLIIPFIRNADDDASVKHTGHGLALEGGGPRTVLLQHHKPEKLVKLLNFQLPENGGGKDALLEMVEKVLKYSVNTWDQGFLDKLYASTNAVCISRYS